MTAAAEVRPARLEALFRSLVEVYSPFGKEEEVLALLEEFCAEQGVPYGVQPVDGERYNLVLGHPDAELLFVGHVDTVEAWDLEAVGPLDLGEGRVGGLGTADMKGGCAAMLEAFLVLRDSGWGSRIGLALVVGEEGEGDGAATFLREARPGRVIVGEPTGLKLCAGHFGYVEAAFRASGRTVHASLPELGENAAEALLKALHDLIGAGGLRGNLGAVVNIR
ncbi:MAG TPA: M20/M25/M40 family metallo-hydrolase, partial [Deferrisomatales bacterium]|nr:M20/M25/M40 family metallo-hydrolase [Deferrisomatales bacterium]